MASQSIKPLNHLEIVKNKTILRGEREFALDQVSGENDKGGISNDVNQEKRFFRNDSVDATIACVPIKYKETIKKLHQNLIILLKVVPSISGLLRA